MKNVNIVDPRLMARFELLLFFTFYFILIYYNARSIRTKIFVMRISIVNKYYEILSKNIVTLGFVQKIIKM